MATQAFTQLLLLLVMLISCEVCQFAQYNLNDGNEQHDDHFVLLKKAGPNGEKSKDVKPERTSMKQQRTKCLTVGSPFSVLHPLLCGAGARRKPVKSITNRRDGGPRRSKRHLSLHGIISNETEKKRSVLVQREANLQTEKHLPMSQNKKFHSGVSSSSLSSTGRTRRSRRSTSVPFMTTSEEQMDDSWLSNDKDEDFKETDDSSAPVLNNMNEFGLFRDQDTSFLKYTTFKPPINFYRCGRCSCFRSVKNMIHADCTSRFYSGVPQNLPANTAYLDLGKNHIFSLQFSNFTNYPSLRILKVSENSIGHLKNTSCSSRLKINSLDLSFNEIKSIDDGSFSCLPRLKYLYVGHNQIHIITNLTLMGLSGLKVLDLSYNVIQRIEHGAFRECKNLHKLILNHNKEMSYGAESFNKKIFEPLTRLRTLSVQFFQTSLDYPVEALLNLKSIRELNIDAVEKGHFDIRLKNLTLMTHLAIGVNGHCRTRNISDSYFEGFPNLISVHISNCVSGMISPHAFDGNPILENIRYTHMGYNLSQILSSLSGVTHSVKSLTINNMFRGLKHTPCQSLSGDQVKELTNMASLEELNLDDNLISMTDYHFLINLPKSLKRFSVRKNMLYYYRSILMYSKEVPGLSNLTHLHEDMQNQVILFNGDDVYKPIITQYYQTETESCHDRSLSLLSAKGSRETSFENKASKIRDSHFSSSSVGYVLPHNLQVYTATQSFYFGQVMMSKRLLKNRLLVYNVSDTYTKNWGMKHLSRWIQFADLSNNACAFIANHFFHVNNSLKQLHLRGNFLGDDFAMDWKGEKLSRLRKVRYIDISGNHIHVLPRNFFIGLVNVEVVKLSTNNIQFFNVSTSHMVNLQFIDLSRNAISWISKHTRNDLDQITLKHPVYIDLTSNLLPCTCEGIELLLWMATSNIRWVNEDFLQCVDSHNNKMWMGNLHNRATDLQRSCLSKANLVLISTFSVTFVFLVMMGIWIFRNRWWLYYIKNITITKFYGYRVEDKENQRDNYTFDAYIIYSSHDRGFIMNECVKELEEQRGHKLCLEDRNFLLGTFTPCNITSAIKNSRVTVPLITPNFGKDEWTEYSLQMAIMESLHSKRAIIHLLIYKPMAVEDMPRYLIKLHKDTTFSEYPPRNCTAEVTKAFWDAVSRAIKNPSNPDAHQGQ